MGRWAQARRRGGAGGGLHPVACSAAGSADGSTWYIEIVPYSGWDRWDFELEYSSGGWQPLAAGSVDGPATYMVGDYTQGAWTDMRGRVRAWAYGAPSPWSDYAVWQVQL